MPKGVVYAAMILMILAMIPPAMIARSRAVPSDKRRIHFIQDMDNQGKFRAQAVNEMFGDGRAMRPVIEGTVARGELKADAHFEHGYQLEKDQAGKDTTLWFDKFPGDVKVDAAFLARGHERFDIYCSPCHGLAGYGDGIVNKRGMELVEAGGINGTSWVQAKSLHEDTIRIQPVGQLFNTITNGIRNMPAYESQIPTADRWAIVAYVKALQRSQHALPTDVTDAGSLKEQDSPEKRALDEAKKLEAQTP